MYDIDINPSFVHSRNAFKLDAFCVLFSFQCKQSPKSMLLNPVKTFKYIVVIRRNLMFSACVHWGIMLNRVRTNALANSVKDGAQKIPW